MLLARKRLDAKTLMFFSLKERIRLALLTMKSIARRVYYVKLKKPRGSGKALKGNFFLSNHNRTKQKLKKNVRQAYLQQNNNYIQIKQQGMECC